MKKVSEYHDRAIEASMENLKNLLKESILEMLEDETEIITVNTAINDTSILKDIEPVIGDDEKIKDVIVEISYLDSNDFLYYSLYNRLDECSIETLLTLFEYIKSETK